jgi:hypothetical protein
LPFSNTPKFHKFRGLWIYEDKNRKKGFAGAVAGALSSKQSRTIVGKYIGVEETGVSFIFS